MFNVRHFSFVSLIMFVFDIISRQPAEFFIVSSSEHPAGRALSSDWFVNSFIMFIYEKIYGHILNRKFRLKILTDSITILFKGQSEVSAPPAGSERNNSANMPVPSFKLREPSQ